MHLGKIQPSPPAPSPRRAEWLRANAAKISRACHLEAEPLCRCCPEIVRWVLLLRPKLSIQRAMTQIRDAAPPQRIKSKHAGLTIHFLCPSGPKGKGLLKTWEGKSGGVELTSSQYSLMTPCCYSDPVQGLWPFPASVMFDKYPSYLTTNWCNQSGKGFATAWRKQKVKAFALLYTTQDRLQDCLYCLVHRP